MALTRSQTKTQSNAASQAEASSSNAQASDASSTSASTSRATQSKRKVSKGSIVASSSTDQLKKSKESPPKETKASQQKKAKNVEPKKSKSTGKRTKKEENASAPPKKKRMSKKAQMEEALRHFAPQHRKLQERLFRAQTQKMIVVQRTVVNTHRQTFDVLGSTGNKYTVYIGPTIKCECRDFIYRRTHCKHILMVLTKVFHVNATSAACQSLHLSEPELEDVFATCTPDASVIASEQVQRQLEHKLYGKPLPQEDDAEGPRRRPLDTSDCPVCFEEFTEAELPVILFCKSCGNNIHKSCFDTWRSQGRSKVTCVYCRAEWVDEASGSKKVNLKHLRNEEGYVNLGELAGLSSKRDTSTYGL